MPPKRPKPTAIPAEPAVEPPGWLRGTFGHSLLASGLLWAALPPLQLSPLAWLAPIPWIRLAEREKLPGKRPYLSLWLSGFLFWLVAIYWLTLPHWATAFGWLALSFYLAFYTPAFVALSRVAVHRWRLSLIVAAPVIWTGLELARAHILGGFMMGVLGHTQYRWHSLIQISDVAGAYAVSFLIVLVAACFARLLPLACRKLAWWPLAPAAVAIVAAVGYGEFRLAEQTERPGPKVALIQGSIDIQMKADPNLAQTVFDHYFRITAEALQKDRNLDLIVWPETMFRTPWFTFSPGYQPPADVQWKPEELSARSRADVQSTAALVRTPVLLGIERVHYAANSNDRFNSAVMTDRAGNAIGFYDKCHLVMFGEYVPFAEYFPWLYNLTPLHGGVGVGTGPQSFALATVRYAPNICYESTVPHLIRGQVTELRARGEEPDVLVNLTNDGWFWGSTELDMHLVCGVFRAIECRKPFLIAANTGISAWIDSNGRIQAQGDKRVAAPLIADTKLDSRRSCYLAIGDWPAGACLVICIAAALAGGWQWRTRRVVAA